MRFRAKLLLIKVLGYMAVALAGNVINQIGYTRLTDMIFALAIELDVTVQQAEAEEV